MKADLVVRGQFVLPERTLRDGWLAVSNDKIVALGIGEAPPSQDSFDAGPALVFPGVVDGQTHATSYGGLAGLEPTTRSAVAGGVTTIVDMPYDNPEPMYDMVRFTAKREAINDLAHCDVALYATVMPDQALDALPALIAAGVVAYKISYFESSPTRFPRIPADRALALMEALAATNLPLGLHNEDQEIVAAATAACRAARMNDIAAHSTARPVAAELSATTHFLELGVATGAHAHLVHLSTARGFDLIAAAVQTGSRATGELCVHYLWFDPETDGDELGALMKVNPPIRAGASDELWHRVTNGGVAFISSDHSSWPVDNKRVASIHDAGAGVPGVETLLPAFHTVANSDGTDRPLLVARMLSEAPARFFGLWPNKGAIIIGADADLAIYMPGDTIWDAESAHDELRWSPYHGRRFDGRVIRTYVRGKLAWDGTDIVNRPGDGRYVPRGAGGWFT